MSLGATHAANVAQARLLIELTQRLGMIVCVNDELGTARVTDWRSSPSVELAAAGDNRVSCVRFIGRPKN